MMVSDRSTSAESVSSLNYSLSWVYFTGLHRIGRVFCADLRKILLYSIGLRVLFSSRSTFRHGSVEFEMMSALSAFEFDSPPEKSLVLDFPTCNNNN